MERFVDIAKTMQEYCLLSIKGGIHYKRRVDREFRGLENIWIEIASNHNHILFGLFCRPPNANANYFSNIEDTIALAVDTNINDIIITGDFNLNVMNQEASRKIYS